MEAKNQVGIKPIPTKICDAYANKIVYDRQINTSQAYRAYSTFMSSYRQPPGNPASNIINQGQKIPYLVPPNAIDEYFKNLEACRAEGLIMWDSEKQLEPSGIMVDIDIIQNCKESQVTDKHLMKLIRTALTLIVDAIQIDAESKTVAHALVLKKNAPSHNVEKDYYKDGFHLRIPTVKLGRMVKRMVLRQLIDGGHITRIFGELKLHPNFTINSILDMNSSHVPPLFAGCNKGSVTSCYKPHAVWRIELNDVANGEMERLAADDAAFVLTHDFSLNYERAGSPVTKREYPLKLHVAEMVASRQQVSVSDDCKGALSIMAMDDADAAYIIKLVGLLSDARAEDHDSWWRVVTALAYEGERYKPLALTFMERRSGGISGKFEDVWKGARDNPRKYGYSIRTIEGMAKEDNYEAFTNLRQANFMGELIKLLFERGGILQHDDVARILKLMIGEKYLTCDDPATRGAMTWYEFVLPGEDEHGDVYKWRRAVQPITIRNYVATHMSALLARAAENVNQMKEGAQDEKQMKWYEKLIKSIKGTSAKMGNVGFIGGIVTRCEDRFFVRGFATDLNREENIMGVGNGILTFKDGRPALVTGYHSYRISRYTNVRYKPLDPQCPITRKVWKSLWSLFPTGEKDAFVFYMSFNSLTLTARRKRPLCVSLFGGGANGKTYSMELTRSMLGSVRRFGYACKIPVQFLIEKEASSNNASPALMPLAHARMAYFSETEQGEELRASKKKALLSGEPLPMRELYGEQQEIEPIANFLLASNHPLRIRSTDHGTWRREIIYWMKMKFTLTPNPLNPFEQLEDPDLSMEKTRDPEFLSAYLGILTMFLGILDRKWGGIIDKVPHPTMLRETQQFRNEQDSINNFITQRVVILPPEEKDTMLSLVDVVNEYIRWYEANYKQGQQDRHDIMHKLRNSQLVKLITPREDGTYWVKGARVLGQAGELNPGEVRFGQEEKTPDMDLDAAGPAAPNTLVGPLNESADDALMRIYQIYEDLCLKEQ
jgi:phage/plasmid-associated DNA primase